MLKKFSAMFSMPTKKQAIIFTTIWIVGIILLIIAMTNFFSESFLQRKYFILYFLFFSSSLSVLRLWSLFWKNNRQKATN